MQTLPRRQFITRSACLRLALQLIALLPIALLPTTSGFSYAADKAAPPILLANILGPDVDPANYLISEKFDGVRAIWDGKVLKFRSGREVAAPRWFIDKLPPQALDGELWLARGRFEELSGIVRKAEPVDAEWQQIKYQIFELPKAPGTFAERAQRIREIVGASQWPQLVAVD